MAEDRGIRVRLRCPVCARKDHVTLLSVPFTDSRVWLFLSAYYGDRIPRGMLDGVEYKVVRCESCGLMFQENILSPSNMETLYEKWVSTEQSFHKKASADFRLFRSYGKEIEGIWKFFGTKPSQINVLEFGSGWGFWASMARSYGFNVTCVEISPSRIEYASRSGLKVISDFAQQRPESFHYIYSNQVFEHLSNPREVLQGLSQVLAPSGVVHLQVPDGRGMERKLKEEHWEARKDALHPLEHINCFTRSSLKVLADGAGLKLVKPRLSFDCSGFGSLVSSSLRYIRDVTSSTRVYLMKSPADTRPQ